MEQKKIKCMYCDESFRGQYIGNHIIKNHETAAKNEFIPITNMLKAPGTIEVVGMPDINYWKSKNIYNRKKYYLCWCCGYWTNSENMMKKHILAKRHWLDALQMLCGDGVDIRAKFMIIPESEKDEIIDMQQKKIIEEKAIINSLRAEKRTVDKAEEYFNRMVISSQKDCDCIYDKEYESWDCPDCLKHVVEKSELRLVIREKDAEIERLAAEIERLKILLAANKFEPTAVTPPS